ncbi:NlpC/P60 family protein [Enterococcus gilvus]|jgi:flagellum-specific peptidoglycan hydrolase FlgJ|uniref:C40 family peptidase n=1 Tax=Enterococcus gilvus TaxID=160453 RepID=UPI003ED91438
MSNKVLTRRERRQQKRQKTTNYRYLKKGSAVVGTALVTVSVAAPLLNTHKVEAVEGKTTATTSNVDQKAFINEISSQIKPLAEKHDLYASIMIAQAIVESDWGNNEYAQAPYYNLFGLEGQYQGQSAMLDKKDSGNGQTEKKELKKYGSYKEAIQDYIEIIKTTSRDGNENYFSGTWRSNAKDYQAAAAALAGRLNEDQGYVQKLVSTIQEHDLTSYDATQPVTPPVAQPAPAEQAATAAPEQPKEYTVQSGDTVNSITDQFGIGVKEFTDWNNIDDSTIYAGQSVIVGNGAVTQDAAPAPQAAPVETAPVENVTPQAPAAEQPAVNTTASTDVSTLASTSDIAQPQPTSDAPAPAEQAPAVKQDQPAPAPEKQAVQNDQAAQQQAAAQKQQQEQAAQQAAQQQQEQAAQQQAAQQQQEQAAQQQQEQAAQQQAAQQQQDQAAQQQQSTDATRGQQVVNEAEKYIGTPYVWGGKDTSGFDCSGLTQYVYKQVTGKDIGVWTVAQESSGTQISVDQAQQGDLLFWGDKGSSYHVAISAGGDQYIHAPQPGENVKYGSTQYYSPDFGVRVY